ncbi:MAG: helicase-associated domain-containing protein, partial [Anaerolineae bacterium]|nr:helicase-associated domain-containing protein [Anaerolineae bacterium]
WLLLGAEPPAIPAESGRVIVQPNFHIFAFDPISDAVLARLDSFATRLKAERAIEYELTAASVYRAQQNGQKVAEIVRWLEDVTGAPLPQNILRSLEEWQAAFERILIRPRVGWVQTASAELADQLMADPVLSEAIIQRVGATSVMVHADKVDLIERRLLAAGELPVRTSKAEEAHKASIVLAADGAIRFAHSTPSLYVFGQLFPLADQTPEGWRITPASVRRATAAGLDAPKIIARLETLALGDVPAELQMRIKAWSKYYGDANVQTLTLVQFRDQSVVNELCADPILAMYLRPFKPSAGLGLAVVRPEDVSLLRGLLAERGIDLIES